jgi:hypothetical protein
MIGALVPETYDQIRGPKIPALTGSLLLPNLILHVERNTQTRGFARIHQCGGVHM